MMKRILAWIALIVIAGLLIATTILSILGSPLFIPMLGLTMGVSIVFWVMLWFMGLWKEQPPTSKESSTEEEKEHEEESDSDRRG